jgi:hypothetical protein
MIKVFKADSVLENTTGVGLNVNGVLIKNSKIDYAGFPIGTAASTVAAGNDSRFTDARTPSTHASTHVTGGTDVIPSAVSGGAAGLLTGADKTKLDGIAAGANLYVHPNHTGDVTSTSDGATVISNYAVTLSKMADMPTASLIGRTSTGTGSPEIVPIDTINTMLGTTSGTWTPSIYATITNPTLTYVSRAGNYTIIANSLVFLNVYIVVNTITSNGSGSTRINLPIGLTPAYNTSAVFHYSYYDKSTAGAVLVAQINTNGYIYIQEDLDNGATSYSAITRLKNNAIVQITGIYAI